MATYMRKKQSISKIAEYKLWKHNLQSN